MAAHFDDNDLWELAESQFRCKQFGIHDNETGTKLAGQNVMQEIMH